MPFLGPVESAVCQVGEGVRFPGKAKVPVATILFVARWVCMDRLVHL